MSATGLAGGLLPSAADREDLGRHIRNVLDEYFARRLLASTI
ncbi:MAG TPA: hypothetical protein VE077_15435 [Candidatus Methylomirabilis sp.]|nr:hypothetical protein [Candidatus Methylomirabilis sp.]